MTVEPIHLSPGDALILVDVQNDFLPGGALAVPRGGDIIPVLNGYLARFGAAGAPVVATRDWHPVNHCSFQAQGGPWPPHCIANTFGAEFPTKLKLPADATIVSKATAPGRDAYSGFQDTELDAVLRAAGAGRLFIGGLATDYCVLSTVRDARQRGYTVLLLEDAVRAVDLKPGDGRRAIDEMKALGATAITLQQLS
ncbi:MAG TPA: isochorismatase family protein [Gammaproteobacteria bacterium]|nr:isochorismatase family protein [Gammaproteobacteria bacterium]